MNERDIFIAARGKTAPTSRAAFLDEACAGDVGVRQRIERLLRADGEHDCIVDEPAVAAVDQTVTITLDSSLDDYTRLEFGCWTEFESARRQ